MKKIAVLFASVVFAAVTLNAQVAPGMKYKDLKDIYNTRDYVKSYTDPYSPGWSAVGSLVIPGLGQVCCGETGRGLTYFAGNLACNITGSIVGRKLMDIAIKDSDNKITGFSDESKAKKYAAALVAIGIVALTVDISAIVDAVKVAKVKNMYNQDLFNGRTNEFKMYPSVGYIPSAYGLQPTAGVGFAMTF